MEIRQMERKRDGDKIDGEKDRWRKRQMESMINEE